MPAKSNVVRAIARHVYYSTARNESNAFVSYKPQHEVSAPNAAVINDSHDSGSAGKSLLNRAIAVKDNICTTDFPTTCASRMLEDFESPYDATLVRQLRENGAFICGKTNMDEFGMGSHSMNSFFGSVSNMSSDDDGEALSVGGSSGGSAMAVAEGSCWAAIGTDTGGSVRLPAAYTGVFGFKPSYGLISRWGVIAYANSLDTVGILADSTEKIRQIFSVISTYDQKDPTSLLSSTRSRIEESSRDWLQSTRSGLRIGVPSDYNIIGLDDTVRGAWVQALKYLQSAGHDVVPVSLPSTKHALSAYYILAPAEASSNLAKYDGVRYGFRADGPDDQDGTLYSRTRGQGFGEEVKRRILLGSYTLSAEAMSNYFVKAQKIRRLVQREFDGVFSRPSVLLHDDYQNLTTDQRGRPGVDFLLCPTAPSLPPRLSEVEKQSPVQTYMADVFTVPASLAGLPAINVPFRVNNTPGTVGIQIIGQFGMDRMVLDVASCFEKDAMAGPPFARRPSNDLTGIGVGADVSTRSKQLETKSQDLGQGLKFSRELIDSYVSMRKVYGNVLNAVHYHGPEDKKTRNQ